MWVKEITWPLVMVALVSVGCAARILSVAMEIRRGGKSGARRFSSAIIGTVTEIGLATFAVFLDHLILWAIIKTAARLIEYALWERFYRNLRSG